MNPIGKVTHYYDKISVAIIDLFEGSLRVGQEIKFKKGDDEFIQTINSLQKDHQVVEEVKSGEEFGLQVDQKTDEGTEVYLT